MGLEKYKDIFGKQNTGLHSIRFGNIAIIDYIFTLLVAIIISLLSSIPLTLSTMVLLFMGEIMHYSFGIETATIKYLQ